MRLLSLALQQTPLSQNSYDNSILGGFYNSILLGEQAKLNIILGPLYFVGYQLVI